MPRLIDLDAAASVASPNIILVSQGGIARRATVSQLLALVLQVANNLSDLNDAAAARANLGLGDVAVLGVGNGLEINGGDLQVDLSVVSSLSGGQLTGILEFTRNFSVSAAGTVQGDATALTAQFNVVTTVASGSGVILPTHGPIWIRNAGANALKIWPPVGDNINALSANAAATLPVGASAILDTADEAQWYTF